MLFNDFIFSYNESLKNDLRKKKKIRFIKKFFYYPYKFLLDKCREIFLIKKKNLDKNTIKGKRSLSMIMPRKLSINIDENYDLELAKYLLKKSKNVKIS